MKDAATDNRRNTNRLAGENSPYLLQHAHNPVDWYPWGDRAFEKAREEDKPVFLSIGYSTCHWCHVMESESFESDDVARLLNDHFVAVKVDREERPDIDSYYMTASQLLTGSGGWPLTVFLTPEREPFYSATYIPRASFPGRTGMLDLLPAIATTWKDRRGKVMDSVTRIASAIESTLAADLSGDGMTQTLHRSAFDALSASFDEVNGGFGNAPKFPSPHNLIFLLRYWKRTGEEAALRMVEKTLTAMGRGGMYDHLGFGFHRYSTDAEWHLPHFEKMLYDQAMIAIAYLEGYQATANDSFRSTAEEVFTYVLRDLRAPEGGFYTAEDADSSGEEGLYYLWSVEELREILGDDAEAVIAAFGMKPGGNFRDEAKGTMSALNLLDRNRGELPPGWESMRKRLLEVRGKRSRPLLDDKILADWNGLMISALALGARILGNGELAEAAVEAAGFVLGEMTTGEGALLHRYRRGEASIPGYLDDYGFFIQGLIDLHQATGDTVYLGHASALAERMIADFLDREKGGFYLSSLDGGDLRIRQKSSSDGAIPSGNSGAIGDLFRLSWLTGKSHYADHALETGRAFSRFLERAPNGHAMMLGWHELLLAGPVTVVVVGDPESQDTREKLDALKGLYLPNLVVLLKSIGDATPPLAEIAPFTEEYHAIDGAATAYVCRDYVCNLPTTDTEEMLSQINGSETAAS